MRRHKEIVILLALLAGAMAFVLWYVVDRRAKLRSAPAAAPKQLGPVLAPEPVDLTEHDAKTIDFSSGTPVIKDTPEDQAAIAAAKKEMDAALKEVSFETKKPEAPKP